jgi:hypothetical protein
MIGGDWVTKPSLTGLACDSTSVATQKCQGVHTSLQTSCLNGAWVQAAANNRSPLAVARLPIRHPDVVGSSPGTRM